MPVANNEFSISSVTVEPLAIQPPQPEDFTTPEAITRSSGRMTRFLALAALTLVAGWLRFTGTSFGLPDKFRPDEEYLVSRALDFETDWNPHFAIYPAAQMYVQHAALKYYAALRGERANFRAAYADDYQALAYLVGRRVSVAMGTATVPAIYIAAAPAFGPEVGIAAAAIMTFSTLPMRESKYATTDAATALWLTLVIAMALRIVRRGGDLDYLGAGLFAGLATATKYPAGAVVFAVAAAHVGNVHRRDRPLWRSIADPRIYMAAWAAIVTFCCATPYLLLDWTQTVTDFQYQRGFLLYGVGNPQAGYGWPWLMTRAMPDSLGIALQIYLLVSMLWALVRPKPGTFSLLGFITLAFIGMTRSHYVFYRYLMVPMPAMAILGGVLLADLRRLASARLGERRGKATAMLGLALLLAPSLIRDLQLNRLLLQTDTRTLARQWIEAHLSPGTPIAATDATTPYGKPQLYLNPVLQFDSPDALKARGVGWVMSDSFPPLAYYSHGLTDAELALLNSRATLVFDADPLRPGASTPVFDTADAFYAPIRHISSMRRPGPRIRIWKLK